MKKIIVLLVICTALINATNAQFFQGSFERDATDNVNLKIAFKMKPSASISTQIAYMEAAFRYPTSTTSAFTIDNISSNTGTFPGLNVQRFTPNYVAGGFTYIKFVFNTGVIPGTTYTTANEYRLFTITTSLPASSTPAFEMISNLQLAQYQFGTVNGSGSFIDPGANAQLYGPGYTKVGNDHILPLFASALPVKFRSFSVTKKEKDALLTWLVENQDANTSHYEIERSLNGTDFSSIQTIAAIISSVSTATYTSTDANIISLDAATIYYRIKQVDKDGRFVYSDVKSIKLHNNGGSSLYPNPASHSSLLSFTLVSSQKVNIIVMDAAGKAIDIILLSGVKGLNQKRIDVSRLAAGAYKVIIKSGEKLETLKLLKGL